MTKKNPDITSAPAVVSFVSDWEVFQDFKNLVGNQNVSKELRAMIKDRVSLQKNEQALTVDPLNLYNRASVSNHHPLKNTDKSYRQTSLFETFDKRIIKPEINDYVNSINDVQRLSVIVNNSRQMFTVAQTRVKNLGNGSR